MNALLFRAIVAMDAYNRGYAPGIKDLGGLGAMVGNATIVRQSAIDTGTPGVNAGFYAVAYSLPDGSTVISYRGTDQNAPAWIAGTGIGSDAINGYDLSLGSPYSAQTELAIPFN